MIIVDLYVPAINQTFDFQMDENVTVRQLTDEIVEMLQRKITGRIYEPDRSFSLCSYELKGVLPADKTLHECGITNGSKLLIV